MEVKKKILYVWAVLIVTVIGAIFISSLNSNNVSGNSINSGEIQKVIISMNNNWEYSPNVIRVKAGVPVELSLDSSVKGCFRDLIIPELKLKKYLVSPSDTLVFTPEKGSYVFACSMYMGKGKIIAE